MTLLTCTQGQKWSAFFWCVGSSQHSLNVIQHTLIRAENKWIFLSRSETWWWRITSSSYIKHDWLNWWKFFLPSARVLSKRAMHRSGRHQVGIKTTESCIHSRGPVASAYPFFFFVEDLIDSLVIECGGSEPWWVQKCCALSIILSRWEVLEPRRALFFLYQPLSTTQLHPWSTPCWFIPPPWFYFTERLLLELSFFTDCPTIFYFYFFLFPNIIQLRTAEKWANLELYLQSYQGIQPIIPWLSDAL